MGTGTIYSVRGSLAGDAESGWVLKLDKNHYKLGSEFALAAENVGKHAAGAHFVCEVTCDEDGGVHVQNMLSLPASMIHQPS